jgi:hypothetical protein
MSIIHHRIRPATNLWWAGAAAAVLLGILLSMVIANAHHGATARADTTGATTVNSAAGPVDNPCSLARQDALSVELARSRCSAVGAAGTSVTNPCFAARQDALSVELARSGCTARRP